MKTVINTLVILLMEFGMAMVQAHGLTSIDMLVNLLTVKQEDVELLTIKVAMNIEELSWTTKHMVQEN